MIPLSSRLKELGLKDTQPRRLIVRALEQSKKPSSPYDIQKWIAKKNHAVNAVTVYRTLEVLSKLHLVHRHPCDGKFALCSMPNTPGHHGFLHCSSCDNTTEFADSRLCKIEDAIADKSHFKVDHHVSEIVGTCQSCR